jgi:hypothetical protein
MDLKIQLALHKKALFAIAKKSINAMVVRSENNNK